jgi:hypothetical protein
MGLFADSNLKWVISAITLLGVAFAAIGWLLITNGNAKTAIELAKPDHEAIRDIQNTVKGLGEKFEVLSASIKNDVGSIKVEVGALTNEVHQNAQVGLENDLRTAGAVDRLSIQVHSGGKVCPSSERSAVEALQMRAQPLLALPAPATAAPKPTVAPTAREKHMQERF